LFKFSAIYIHLPCFFLLIIVFPNMFHICSEQDKEKYLLETKTQAKVLDPIWLIRKHDFPSSSCVLHCSDQKFQDLFSALLVCCVALKAIQFVCPLPFQVFGIISLSLLSQCFVAFCSFRAISQYTKQAAHFCSWAQSICLAIIVSRHIRNCWKKSLLTRSQRVEDNNKKARSFLSSSCVLRRIESYHLFAHCLSRCLGLSPFRC
jgi:hypothetical protein